MLMIDWLIILNIPELSHIKNNFYFNFCLTPFSLLETSGSWKPSQESKKISANILCFYYLNIFDHLSTVTVSRTNRTTAYLLFD